MKILHRCAKIARFTMQILHSSKISKAAENFLEKICNYISFIFNDLKKRLKKM